MGRIDYLKTMIETQLFNLQDTRLASADLNKKIPTQSKPATEDSMQTRRDVEFCTRQTYKHVYGQRIRPERLTPTFVFQGKSRLVFASSENL